MPHNDHSPARSVEVDPDPGGLAARAAGLLARFGPPVRFAARAVLGTLIPGGRDVVDLVAALLEAVDPASSAPNPSASTSAADRKRIAEVLEMLDGELAELVSRVAALEGRADAAGRVIEAAIVSDPGCRVAVDRLSRIGFAASARTLGLDHPTGPLVVLEVVAGPHQGVRFEYDRHDTLLVGRGAAANLQLIDDPHFSRHHFLIEVNPPRIYLRDLGSSNGTRVNGQPVTECHLGDGDEITGGKTRLLVTLPKPKPDPGPTATGKPTPGGATTSIPRP